MPKYVVKLFFSGEDVRPIPGGVLIAIESDMKPGEDEEGWYDQVVAPLIDEHIEAEWSSLEGGTE